MKLSYKTAKRLKYAGFPQDEWSLRWCLEVFAGDSLEHMKMRAESYGVFNDEQVAANKALIPMCVAPTLSELIEACEPTEKWAVIMYITDTQTTAAKRGFTGTGPNPDEAVAELWLVKQKP